MEQFQRTYWTRQDWPTRKFNVTWTQLAVGLHVCVCVCVNWTYLDHISIFHSTSRFLPGNSFSPRPPHWQPGILYNQLLYVYTTWFRGSRKVVDSFRVAAAKKFNHSVHKSEKAVQCFKPIKEAGNVVPMYALDKRFRHSWTVQQCLHWFELCLQKLSMYLECWTLYIRYWKWNVS
jgi:hypothetical protein